MDGGGRGRKEGKVLFTHLFCDPTSQEAIVSVFLMTVNSPVTVEVSKVVWNTWNLTRMDLGRETPDLLEDTRALL